jgi:hypothetical protein
VIDALFSFSPSNSRTRRNLTASTSDPDLLLRSSKLWIYLSGTNGIRVNGKRTSCQRLSNAHEHLSSIFRPSNELPHLGYGDLKGTQHALLFLFGKDDLTLDVLLAKGRKSQTQHLYEMLASGDLEGVVQTYRNTLQSLISTNKGLLEDTFCPALL